jgi:hypothetical protein
MDKGDSLIFQVRAKHSRVMMNEFAMSLPSPPRQCHCYMTTHDVLRGVRAIVVFGLATRPVIVQT